MKIGVDATCWLNQRGYGRHGRALLRSLVALDPDNRYTFVVDWQDSAADDFPEGVEVLRVNAGSPASLAAAASGRRSIPDMWRMSRALSDPRFDLVLFPTIYSYVPILSRAGKVVIIHDVIPEKFPHLTMPRLTARAFWKVKVGLGRRQADAIVTVSEYSRQEIMAHFGLPAGRVFVAGEASDPIFQRLDQPTLTGCLRSLGVPETGRLVTYVGGFGPHKNLEALILSFANLAGSSENADLRLVLVGEYRKEVFFSDYETIRKQIEVLGISQRVIFTGYLPDEELVVLLNRSAVLVLPSLMEGFGLPAVEAAACGCPVIATTASPLPSLLGAGGLYIDPARTQELSVAMERVLGSESLRQEMSRAGLAASARLTWEAAAGQLAEVLDTVAGRKRRGKR